MTTTDQTDASAPIDPEAEERRRQRDEARLIRTREAAARRGTAASEGQWASGDRTPLNPNEELKATSDPLEVRDRIEKLYANWGFWSIPPGDLRGRMRWWGLYTQRKPGIDGGKTAILEPHELDDEYFMLRIRSDRGRLNLAQARTVAGISREFGRNTADVTDRQNIQLHWIAIEDVPEIFRRLESVGLYTTEACGDCPRVIVGSPVNNVSKDQLLDPDPQIQEIIDKYIGNPEFSNLPRKFKTALTGQRVPDVAHEVNDISFCAVEHPELGLGYDVWVGGGLSITPHLGNRLGAFVRPEEVADVWEGVVSIFRDHGFRRLRTKARLKFIVQAWGIEKFRQVLEDEYLGRKLPDGPAPEASPAGRTNDHIGVHEQKDGRYYIGVAPSAGRIDGETLDAIADLAEAAGSDRIQLTSYQKIVIVDVAADKVNDTMNGLRELDLETSPGQFRRNTMACTGIEYCKLAIVETKASAQQMAIDLDNKFPTLEDPITVHVNGCPNSCARIQVADIGFKGQMVLDTDSGEQVPGYQVLLGGNLGEDAKLGRKLRRHKVLQHEMTEYVERVTANFLDDKADGEAFATWAQRADEELLR